MIWIDSAKLFRDKYFRKRILSVPVVILFFICTTLYAGPIEDCAEYAKMGIPGEAGVLLCRKGYLLAHSHDNKTPLWVIEHLTAAKAKANDVQRYNKFQADPDLQKGDRAELNDYRGSGFDKGHMAPSADMKWDQEAMIQCFYLSNMVPQVGKGMNQGIWKRLEDKVRTWAINRGELFIYTGPIYRGTDRKTIGTYEVGVPTHLYKIIYDPNANESIAFIMPNETLISSDMPLYIVTIREVEEETGFDFLSALDQQTQDDIETKKSDVLWQ